MLGIQTQGTDANICVSEGLLVERVLQNIYVDPALVSSHTNLFDNSEECDFVIAYESDLLLSSKP